MRKIFHIARLSDKKPLLRSQRERHLCTNLIKKVNYIIRHFLSIALEQKIIRFDITYYLFIFQNIELLITFQNKINVLHIHDNLKEDLFFLYLKKILIVCLRILILYANETILCDCV